MFLTVPLLLFGELLRAFVLQLQESAFTSGLWSSPIAMQGVAATVGLVQTTVMMHYSSSRWVTMPNGVRHPASDIQDVYTMCQNKPVIAVVLIGHIVAQLCAEVSHMMILHHLSALSRSICDAFKIMFIWSDGKLFWYFGIFTAIAEPWKPGWTGSIMMIPAMTIVVWGMLMYKEDSFMPVYITKSKTGRYHIDFASNAPNAKDQPLVPPMDGSFYNKEFDTEIKKEVIKNKNPDLPKEFIDGNPELEELFSSTWEELDNIEELDAEKLKESALKIQAKFRGKIGRAKAATKKAEPQGKASPRSKLERSSMQGARSLPRPGTLRASINNQPEVKVSAQRSH